MHHKLTTKPIVLHYLYRDDFGGGPKALWSTSRHLSDVSETHIAYKGTGRLSQFIDAQENNNTHQLPNVPDWLFFLDAYFFARLVRKIKPHIIFVYGQRGGVTSAIASLGAHNTIRVYICTFVSLYESWNLSLLVRNYIAEKITLKRHNKIVCTSEGNIRLLTHLGLVADRYKVHLIPNTVESNLAPIITSINLSIWKNNNSIKFLYLGRLVPGKRVDWLLKAWCFAINTGMDGAELAIVGDGSELANLRELAAQLNIQKTVQFVPQVADPRGLLFSCDVLVFPSQYEGHAFVPIEALAAGKPVIAMDADGVRESLDDAIEGYICPLGDWKMFGEKIVLMALNPYLRQRMGENALSRSRKSLPAQSRIAFQCLIAEILQEQENVRLGRNL